MWILFCSRSELRCSGSRPWLWMQTDTQFFHLLFLHAPILHDRCIFFIPWSSWKFTSYDPLKTKIVGLLGRGGGATGIGPVRPVCTHPYWVGVCPPKLVKTKALLILAVLYNNFGNDLPQHGSWESLLVGRASHWHRTQ